MPFQTILKFFQPKDKIFFSLFEEVAEAVNVMAKLLKEIVHTNDFDKRATLISQVEDLEHKNDDLTHKIFTELGKNFITPFDREDIHYLASSLDDIADYIYATAKKINFYKVNPNDPGIHKLAECIEESVETVKLAVFELRNMKNVDKIKAALVKVNSLENQADDIYDMSVHILFETQPDAKEVIKMKEVYQVMEKATDKCEDAANAIESIVIKYA
ncbi:MAG: hypothetical protein JWN78_2264 [Bacteroidota bacterium]|nr:hypothetical protein [Bacteroidota bacterium]